MRGIRLSCAAALLVATTAAPAGATALPTWSAPQILSAPAATIAQMSDPTINNRIAAAPDGSVTVAWVQNDGSNDRLVARRFSATSGSWTAPAYVSAAGEDAYVFSVMMDDDGNATLAWTTTALGMRGATLLARGSAWSDPVQLEQTGESINGGGVGTGPDGTVLAAYELNGGDEPQIKIRTRARNSTMWGPATTIALDPSLLVNGQVNFDFNSDGDGALMFFAHDASHHVFVLRFDHGTQSWSTTPQEVASSASDFNAMSDIAVAANGDLAVAYEDEGMTAYVRILGSDGTAAAAQSLAVPGTIAVLPQLAADSADRFVAVWQTMPYDMSDFAVRFVSSNADGSWSQTDSPAGADTDTGAPMLAATADGELTLAFTSALADSAHTTPRVTRWSATGRGWGSATPIAPGRATVATGAPGGEGSLPRIAVDEGGHTYAMWSDSSTTPFGIGFSVLDQAPPKITSVHAPYSALTDEDIAVSTVAADLWSGIESIGWDFGDGGSATGASAHHRYAAAGDYTIRVTITDGAGNTRAATRTIAVDDPDDGAPGPDEPDDTSPLVDEEPAPDPPAPRSVAPRRPAIEAALKGRTIRLNARVRATRARCRGRAIVAYNMPGGRRYTASVTLVRTATGCRASGTIRLARTPARRTVLRLTVRSPRIKTRTVTVRR